MKKPPKIRKRPGTGPRYMRERYAKKFSKTLFGGIALYALLFGVFMGPWLYDVVPSRVVDMAWNALLAVVLALFVMLGYVRRQWNKKHAQLQKGIQAENETGQLIEYSVVMSGCAVAHNVKAFRMRGKLITSL